MQRAYQGQICLHDSTPCHTEVADQTCYLTLSQYTDTGPNSPSTDPRMRHLAWWQAVHFRKWQTWVRFLLLPCIFFQVESYQSLKKCLPVAIQPGAWCLRVSARLRLVGLESVYFDWVTLTFSMAAHTTVWANPFLRYTSMFLGCQATNYNNHISCFQGYH